ERGKDSLILEGLTDHGAEEGRTSRDEAERAEKPPTREVRFTRERSDYAEALGGVVKCEPDDQHQGKTQLPPGRGLADRQTFGEVVETDAKCDEESEPLSWSQTRDGASLKLAYVRRPRAEAQRRACATRKP